MHESKVLPIEVEEQHLTEEEFQYFSEHAGEINYMNGKVFEAAFDQGMVAGFGVLGEVHGETAIYFFKLGREFERNQNGD